MMKIMELITRVKLQKAKGVQPSLFHKIAQYTIQIKSTRIENRIRYQILIFCGGFFCCHRTMAKEKSGRLQSARPMKVKRENMMMMPNILLIFSIILNILLGFKQYVVKESLRRIGNGYIINSDKIMNNYNSPSYYRANPYAQLGYMPPIAQKNRNKPHSGVQMPQGREFFQPTMKKHYGRSYATQIQNDHIMMSPGNRSPLESEALQRSYFRSLNSKDIEGATTNTLISKAVRNKLKAQQVLARKKQMERMQQAQEMNKEKEPNLYDMYHREEKANKGNSPNFHTTQKQQQDEYFENRNRRQSEKLLVSNQNYNYRDIQTDMMRKAREQIGNANQNSLYRNSYERQSNNESKTQDYQYKQANYKTQESPKSYHKSNDNEYSEHQRNQHYKQADYQSNYHQNNYLPQKQQIHQNQYQDYQQQKTRQQNFMAEGHPRNNYQQEQYHSQYQSHNQQPNAYVNYKNSYQSPKYQNQAERSYNQNEYGRNQVQNAANDRKYEYRKETNSGVTGIRNREQMRRFNPTYLSYGSPSFALAGRHLVGNQ